MARSRLDAEYVVVPVWLGASLIWAGLWSAFSGFAFVPVFMGTLVCVGLVYVVIFLVLELSQSENEKPTEHDQSTIPEKDRS